METFHSPIFISFGSWEYGLIYFKSLLEKHSEVWTNNVPFKNIFLTDTSASVQATYLQFSNLLGICNSGTITKSEILLKNLMLPCHWKNNIQSSRNISEKQSWIQGTDAFRVLRWTKWNKLFEINKTSPIFLFTWNNTLSTWPLSRFNQTNNLISAHFKKIDHRVLWDKYAFI